MEILTSVRRLYISFKSLVYDFVYSFGRAALLLLVEVQNHTVPVRERRRIRVNLFLNTPDAVRLYQSVYCFFLNMVIVYAAPRISFMCCSVYYLIKCTGVKQGGVMQVYFQDDNNRRRLFLYVWKKWLPQCHLKKKNNFKSNEVAAAYDCRQWSFVKKLCVSFLQ